MKSVRKRARVISSLEHIEYNLKWGRWTQQHLHQGARSCLLGWAFWAPKRVSVPFFRRLGVYSAVTSEIAKTLRIHFSWYSTIASFNDLRSTNVSKVLRVVQLTLMRLRLEQASALPPPPPAPAEPVIPMPDSTPLVNQETKREPVPQL